MKGGREEVENVQKGGERTTAELTVHADDLYVKMFFMTYRAFVSSNELLRMILAFFEPPPGMAPMTVTRYLPYVSIPT